MMEDSTSDLLAGLAIIVVKLLASLTLITVLTQTYKLVIMDFNTL